MEGVCPTNDCGCTEPFVTSHGNGLYTVGCSKCGGWVSTFINHSDDAYLHAINIWMEVTKEMSPKDERTSRIQEDE